jgi:hypothetical protein
MIIEYSRLGNLPCEQRNVRYATINIQYSIASRVKSIELENKKRLLLAKQPFTGPTLPT